MTGGVIAGLRGACRLHRGAGARLDVCIRFRAEIRPWIFARLLHTSRCAGGNCLFIIDPEGVLRYQVVTDMNVGRSVEETLRVLQALQSGGLCPVNWKPGDKTL